MLPPLAPGSPPAILIQPRSVSPLVASKPNTLAALPAAATNGTTGLEARSVRAPPGCPSGGTTGGSPAVARPSTDSGVKTEAGDREEGEPGPGQAMDLSTTVSPAALTGTPGTAHAHARTLTGHTVKLPNQVSGTIEAPQSVTITSVQKPQQQQQQQQQQAQQHNLPKTITATTIKVPLITLSKNNNNDNTAATLNTSNTTESSTEEDTVPSDS